MLIQAYVVRGQDNFLDAVRSRDGRPVCWRSYDARAHVPILSKDITGTDWLQGGCRPCATRVDQPPARKFDSRLNYAPHRKMGFSSRIEAMFIRLIVGTAAVAGVTVCGLLSTRISYKMADQVNGKLPKEAQFSLIGWYSLKKLRLYREYRGLFPDGHLLLQVLLRLGFNGWLRDNCCVGNRFFRKMRLRRKFSGLRRLL